MKEARSILKGFRVAYRSALEQLRTAIPLRFPKLNIARLLKAQLKKPPIEFPLGTYRLRVLLDVPCETGCAAG